MANPKINPYKLVNPSGSGKNTLASNGPRTNLLAINRIGKTVNSIGLVVKDLHTISLSSIKVDKMREVAERRRLQRERDQRNEDEFERQNALKGKGLKKIKNVKKPKKSAVQRLVDSLFGGLQGLLMGAMSFLASLGTFLVTKGILEYIGNRENIHKTAVFIQKLSFVVKKLYGFAKGSVNKIMDGFSSLVGKDSTFFGRLKGLGTLLLGIVGLGALLNPFGLMDSILRMLNLDFYNPNRNTRSKGPSTSGTNTGRSGPTPKWKKITKTSQNVARRFGKNGSTVYREALKQGLTEAEALKRVKRLANKNPSAFKAPPKTSGLSPKGAPTGKVFGKGLNRAMGRGALKFLGKSNVKMLGKVFQNTFGRIPIFGALLTGVFSVLNGDGWKQAIFKTVGSAVGGALGTLIPIPGIGSLIGMMGGEYVGELLYLGFNPDVPGGGWKGAGKKLRDDLKGLFNNFTKMMSWIKNGWTKFYAGIPKVKIPDFPKDPPNWIPKWILGRNKIWAGAKLAIKAMMGPMSMMLGKSIPNVFWMLNLTGNTFPLFHKAFFKNQSSTAEETSGEAMKGVAGDGEGESTSSSTVSGTASNTPQGKPIRNKRGRIIGYDTGEPKPEPVLVAPPKKNERGSGAKNNFWDWQSNNLSYDNKPFVPQKEYKGVETDNERYGDTMPEGAFGIGSKKTDKKAQKTKSWWNPFSWATGGKLVRQLPRLTTKQYFIGKIFKGITKAVSGVVKGIGSAVGGIMSSPIGSLLGTVVPFVFPAAAPFMGAIKAIGAAASGDIFGAITGGIGALGGMFPGTFGGMSDAFSGFMNNNPLGQALGGFMQGGIGGALGGLMGGLGSILPEGVSGMLNKFGGFMKKFPAVGGLIGMIPGVANVPGLSQLFGLDSFGAHGFSPMGLIGNIADSMGFGGLFRTLTGMMGTGGPGGLLNGLREMAAELGVKPEVLGVMSGQRGSMTSKGKNLSREYAMQSSLEFIPVPMLLEKLTEIQTPVPIPRMVPVPMPAPAQA